MLLGNAHRSPVDRRTRSRRDVIRLSPRPGSKRNWCGSWAVRTLQPRSERGLQPSVNLSAYAYAGSNPAPATSTKQPLTCGNAARGLSRCVWLIRLAVWPGSPACHSLPARRIWSGRPPEVLQVGVQERLRRRGVDAVLQVRSVAAVAERPRVERDERAFMEHRSARVAEADALRDLHEAVGE
jgi:hypothetical protein